MRLQPPESMDWIMLDEQCRDSTPSSIDLGREPAPLGQHRPVEFVGAFKRKLDLAKCDRCRQDKRKCTPQPRRWPQKCSRCTRLGHACSPNTIARRTKPRTAGLSTPVTSRQTTPEVAGDAQSAAAADSPPRSPLQHHGWDYADLMDGINVLRLSSLALLEMRKQFDATYTACRWFTPRDSRKAALDDLESFTTSLADALRSAIHTRKANESPRHGSADGVLLSQALVWIADPLSCMYRPHQDGLPTKEQLAECAKELKEGSDFGSAIIVLAKEMSCSSASPTAIPLVAKTGASEAAAESNSERIDLLLNLHILFQQRAVSVCRIFNVTLPRSVWDGVVTRQAYLLPHLIDTANPQDNAFAESCLIRQCLGMKNIEALAKQGALEGRALTASDWRDLFRRSVSLASCEGRAPEGLKRGMLLVAILLGMDDVVDGLLLEAAHQLPVPCRTEVLSRAFHFAAAKGDEATCAKILRDDWAVNVNITDLNGATPLFYATQNGHAGIVRLLQEYHAKNTKASSGDCAPAARLPSLVLRPAGVGLAATSTCGGVSGVGTSGLGLLDVNTQNADGETALHVGAKVGSVDNVRMLLAHRDVDPNVTDRAGLAPLHKAAMGGHIDVVRMLAERRDVDLSARCRKGMTAVDYARRAGYGAVGAWLEEYATRYGLGAMTGVEREAVTV